MDVGIDTSALIAVIADEPERRRIIEFTTGNTLIGPGSIPWEIGNAFSAMFKQNRLTLDEARKGLVGSPYKTVRVNNFNRLHVIASGSTWRRIRCLQSNKGGYFQTCPALQGLP